MLVLMTYVTRVFVVTLIVPSLFSVIGLSLAISARVKVEKSVTSVFAVVCNVLPPPVMLFFFGLSLYKIIRFDLAGPLPDRF